jgi:4-alpha-glucanotransferase
MQALITIARYLAKRAIKDEWRAQGRKVQYINIRELTQASDSYLREHKAKLMKEAWKHPALVRHRQQQGQRLTQRAVIEAIRQKGQRINSIAPDELQKLVREYVEEHPELRECRCF